MRKLVIYDSDTKYMRSFVLYINEKANYDFECIGFDDKNLFIDYITSDDSIDVIILADETVYDELSNISGDIELISLTENLEFAGVDRRIYKFQKVSSIIKIIYEYFINENQDKLTYVENENSKLVYYFSDNNYKSSLEQAYTDACKNSESTKSLFITLSPIVNGEKFVNNESSSIVDLFYYIDTEKGISKEMIASLIIEDTIDIIPTNNAAIDFVNIDGDDWINLIDQIRLRSGYQSIYIYLNNNIQKFHKLVKSADELIYINNEENNIMVEYFKNKGIDNIRLLLP